MWISNKSILKLSTFTFIIIILLGLLYFKLPTTSLSNYQYLKPVNKLSSYKINNEDDWIETMDAIMKKRKNHLAETCKLISKLFKK